MTSKFEVKCLKRLKFISENSNSLNCDTCKKWIHLRCSGMKKVDFEKLCNDPNSNFDCLYCRKYKCGKCCKAVYTHNNGICCDNTQCNTWFHLKCTHFTAKEYKDKKSDLHTKTWFCKNCLTIPFADLNNDDFSKLNEFKSDLENYTAEVIKQTHFDSRCSVCNRKNY